MISVTVRNLSGGQASLEAVVRQKIDADVLEVFIIPSSELKRHSRAELLLEHPSAEKLEGDNDRGWIS